MYILIWLICLDYKTVSRIHARFLAFWMSLGSGDFPDKVPKHLWPPDSDAMTYVGEAMTYEAISCDFSSSMICAKETPSLFVPLGLYYQLLPLQFRLPEATWRKNASSDYLWQRSTDMNLGVDPTDPRSQTVECCGTAINHDQLHWTLGNPDSIPTENCSNVGSPRGWEIPGRLPSEAVASMRE